MPLHARRPSSTALHAPGSATWQLSVATAVMLTFGAVSRAAPFVNLDFEQATVVPTHPPYYISAPAAFPNWTVRIGGVQYTEVAYNNNGIGEGQVSLWDRSDASNVGQLLQGRYMASLKTDGAFGHLAALSQTGDIPSDARSIRLLGDGGRGPAAVSINGIDIPMVFIGGQPIFNRPAMYGGDISEFSGQTVELTISSRVNSPLFNVTADDLKLSPVPIPEPTSASLAVTSGLLVMSKRPRRFPAQLQASSN